MINPLKIPEMLAQANQMQEEIQRKLNQTIVEGTSGGGAVTATMNGKKAATQAQIRSCGRCQPRRQPARCGNA
jgi:DNA-binding protein YbaB